MEGDKSSWFCLDGSKGNHQKLKMNKDLELFKSNLEKMEATIQLLAALSKGATSADLSIDEAFAGLES